MNFILKIIIYILIVLVIFLFIDFLFKITIRKRKWKQMYYLARQLSIIKQKPIMIIYDLHHAIIEPSHKIQGNIAEIITQMPNNRYILIVSQLLEFETDPKNLIYHCKRISGNDTFFINIEMNSPRIWWDYKLKNIMHSPFYLPHDREIKWTVVSKKQKKIHNLYSIIFKILPYNFFTNNSIMK